MLSQSGMCERSELAANDSDGGRCRGSRMGGVSDGLHSTFSQRPVSSVLKKIKKGVDRTGKVV